MKTKHFIARHVLGLKVVDNEKLISKEDVKALLNTHFNKYSKLNPSRNGYNMTFNRHYELIQLINKNGSKTNKTTKKRRETSHNNSNNEEPVRTRKNNNAKTKRWK